MRFNEFAIPGFSKSPTGTPGYYAVGDSVAASLAATGSPWVSKAKAGVSVSDSVVTKSLDEIPKGSVVAIAVGADDQSVDSPEQLAFKIKGIISHAKSNGLYPIFVLFPANINNRVEKNKQIRDVLKSEIGTAMIDIDSGNGIASFSTIANQIVSLLKPNKGYVPPKIKATGNYPAFKEPGFKVALEKTAANLGVDPNSLIAIMKQESSLDPQARNKSGATGLIQFMPNTAARLGTSTDALYKMTATEQMPWVEKYFKSTGVKPGMGLGDLYVAVFYPAAMGKPDSHVIATSGARGFSGKVYSQNRGLDRNNDGTITVADVKNSVARFA